MSVQDYVRQNQTPIVLVVSWAIVLYCVFIAYFGGSKLDSVQLIVAQGVILFMGFFALMLTIGFFAQRAGFRQAELDREADNILSGRKI
jgi:hypothetical protein